MDEIVIACGVCGEGKLPILIVDEKCCTQVPQGNGVCTDCCKKCNLSIICEERNITRL